MEPQQIFLPHEKQIAEYLKTIEHLKKQTKDTPLFAQEIAKMEKKLDELRKEVYTSLSPWDRVLICRHPARPHSVDYIKNISDSFFELHGDRTFSDDPSVVGGLIKIDGIPFMLVGQEKGADTEDRIKRNFGMVSPEGFRKALRLMKVAAQMGIPVLSLLDTTGAYSGLEAEERGQGCIIAENLCQMFQIETPIIVVVIGEGCSGGALGMGVGDSVAMLEHSYYSVISPEGCASILWKDSQKKQLAATALKLHAEDLLPYGIVDLVLKEPLGGAQYAPTQVYTEVKRHVLDTWNALKNIPLPILLEQRQMKFRKLGVFLQALERE